MPSKSPLKWSDDLYVTFYELARSGLSDKEMAEAAGASEAGLSKWKRERPALRNAIKRGRGKASGGVNGQQTFQDWIYKRLNPRLQKIWDEIVNCDMEPNGIQRIEAVMGACGIRARQSLFIHALIHNNFVLNRALHQVCISRATVERWINEDADFAALHQSMSAMKKEFFEGALIDLVAAGETTAVIFANKTLNADMGYSEKYQHEHNHNHSGTIGIIGHIAIDSLNLPLDTRKAVLKAIEHRAASLPASIEMEDGTEVLTQ